MVTTRLPPARQRGFTYMAVILAVALLGAGLAATGEVWRTVQQREKEKELLYIGNEYRQAIARYVEGGPGGERRFPRRLEDLLLDNRYPSIRRYLRRIYRDPMTGSVDWGLVRTPDGGISGVFSKSEEPPLKVAGFGFRDTRLENATRYSEWIFNYEGQALIPPPPPRGSPQGPAGQEPSTLFPGG